MPSLWEVLKTSKGLPAPDGFTALFAHSLSDTYTLAEISGIPPLNLGKIVEIVDYTIYGNIYQSDGVSPDTPQEVVGCGDRTGNLFDRSTLANNTHLSPSTGLPSTSSARIGTTDAIDVSGLSTVTLTFSFGTAINEYFMYSLLKADGTLIERIAGKQSGHIIDVSSADKMYVAFYIGENNITTDDLQYVMLNSGSTPLPYEPYGYKVDVECRGKNLWYLQSSYSFTTYYDINVNINAGHYLSYIIETNGTTDVYGGTGCQLTFSDNTTQYVLFNATYRKSILLSKDVKIVRMYAGKDYNTSVGFTATVSEIMVSANADDSYEPYTPPITTPLYLDSPLYKIGDYADNRGKTKEVRAIKELVLTEEETINHNSSNNTFYFILDKGYYTGSVRTTPLFCSHYTHIEDGRSFSDMPNDSIYIASLGSAAGAYIYSTDYADLTAFKSYLAAQYANGTPVKVYYVLAEPTAKAVDAVEIPTIQGTNIIDINTEIKPSNLKITYKSKM